jgi:hypothetical protein
MRGGSQAALVDTGDGYYVVKWRQNPQHRRILINEAVCSELLGRLGVSAPEWAWVHADRAFLDANPEVRIERAQGHSAIDPGWHFGSRFPVNPSKELVYDFMPPNLMRKVRNRSAFLKMLVFDTWVDNHDGRQAVFFRVPKRGYRVEMIDHGYSLGFDGLEWGSNSSPVPKPYPGISDLYACTQSAKVCASSIAAIKQVTRDDLAGLLALVPPEWVEDDGTLIARQFDRIMDRGRRLTESVADALAYLRNRPLPERDRAFSGNAGNH